MAYAYIDSTQPATAPLAVFAIKTLAKAQGWTVPKSSDGTTYNAAGDQITTGASGAGGLANNNAWFILQAPDGVRQVLIQRGATNVSWRMLYSASAKFTGGAPGATQTPSATDEPATPLLGGGSHAVPTFTTWFNTDNTYRQFAGFDGASPYPFWFATIPNGGGDPSTSGGGMVFDPVLNAEPSDADPLVIYTGIAAGASLFATASIGSETAGVSSNVRGWLKKGLAGEGFVTISGLYYKNTSRDVVPIGLGSNPHSGKDEELPIIYCRPSAIAAPFGYKGVSRVMRWRGTTRTSGDTGTLVSPRDRLILNSVSVSWGGTVPVL